MPNCNCLFLQIIRTDRGTTCETKKYQTVVVQHKTVERNQSTFGPFRIRVSKVREFFYWLDWQTDWQKWVKLKEREREKDKFGERRIHFSLGFLKIKNWFFSSDLAALKNKKNLTAQECEKGNVEREKKKCSNKFNDDDDDDDKDRRFLNTHYLKSSLLNLDFDFATRPRNPERGDGLNFNCTIIRISAHAGGLFPPQSPSGQPIHTTFPIGSNQRIERGGTLAALLGRKLKKTDASSIDNDSSYEAATAATTKRRRHQSSNSQS